VHDQSITQRYPTNSDAAVLVEMKSMASITWSD